MRPQNWLLIYFSWKNTSRKKKMGSKPKKSSRILRVNLQRFRIFIFRCFSFFCIFPFCCFFSIKLMFLFSYFWERGERGDRSSFVMLSDFSFYFVFFSLFLFSKKKHLFFSICSFLLFFLIFLFSSLFWFSQTLLFFCFVFFIFFFFFLSFCFQSFEQTPKPAKNRREVPVVKRTISCL